MPPPWIQPTWKEFGPHFAILRGQGRWGRWARGGVCAGERQSGAHCFGWYSFFQGWVPGIEWRAIIGKVGSPGARISGGGPVILLLTTYFLLLIHMHLLARSVFGSVSQAKEEVTFSSTVQLFYFFFVSSRACEQGGGQGGVWLLFSFRCGKMLACVPFQKHESSTKVIWMCAGLVPVWLQCEKRLDVEPNQNQVDEWPFRMNVLWIDGCIHGWLMSSCWSIG